MKDKLLHETEWLNLYQTDKGFIYAQRKSVNSIASLCFKHVGDEVMYLIHYQPQPELKSKKCWNDLYPCPITGAIDPNETPLQAAIRETYEEGGIKVDLNQFHDQIYFVPSTQMNEIVYCFIFDVTNLEQEEPKTDGTLFESVSINKWMTQSEVEDILFKNKEIYLTSLLNAYCLVQKHLKDLKN
ncbi:NUDIX domain-containing protein [Mycoplasma sp. E35C]|uniref:NUDIX domain-containing protein n=1 Tax=Mycoplasma sp. E35C TaxID=2801918 RepID=UPI001CA407D6|nr:NUDIX hydrolase [Mycoplasma sp. E35C]QZX49032.1 NUDIX hydrolase [Mycoplasma sp. E35C]